MLANGGEARCDLGAIREQAPLCGEVASDSTAYQLIEGIGSDPELLEGLRGARKAAREHAWVLGVAPDRATIDLDATLLEGHLREGGRGGQLKGGFGFQRPCSPSSTSPSEAAAGMLWAGNAGPNTASDQIAVAEATLEQIPTDRAAEIEVLLRVDSAGATHELLEWAREGQDPLLGRLR